MTPSTQSAFRWRLIPVSLGGILLAAAALNSPLKKGSDPLFLPATIWKNVALPDRWQGVRPLFQRAVKAHALFTDESVVANAFQPGIAAFEFGLGIWLLVGWWSGFARLATLAFFAGAANISLFQFAFGKASCGCFGMLHVAPELVFVLDLVAIVVAALWRPLDSEGTGPSVVKWALVIGVIGAVLVVASTSVVGPDVSLAGSSPVGTDSNYRVVPFDVGTLSPNSSTEHTVRIANDTHVPCHVRAARADCGCIVHQISSEPVNPGSNWELRFRYKAPATPGVVSQRIVLSFAEEDVAPLVVHLRGRVRDWAEAEPNEIDFGDVLAGATATRFLILRTTSKHQLADDPYVVSGLPYVRAEVQSVYEARDAVDDESLTVHRFRLLAAPPRGTPSESHRGEIMFVAADGTSTLRIPCYARVMPKISASPEGAFFGLVGRLEQKTCVIKLRIIDQKTSDIKIDHNLGRDFSAVIEEANVSSEFWLKVGVVRSVHSDPGIRTGTVRVIGSAELSLALPVQAWFE